jgi:hypothetical protein
MRQRLLARFGNRRNLARLVLVAAAAAVGLQVASYLPRETEIEIDLGSRHGDVEEVRLSYLRQGEALRGVSLRFPEGAPPRVRHRVDLSPGRYRLAIELRQRGGATRTSHRILRLPADGTLRVSVP